jgi:hypothetical protein
VLQTQQDLLVVNDLPLERELGQSCCRRFELSDVIEDDESGTR